MILSEDRININYTLFLQKLESLNIPNFKYNEFINDYGEKLKKSVYGINNTEGSFIEIILRKLTKYAVQINDLLPTTLSVDKNTLIKVCLLHQISKIEMFQETNSNSNHKTFQFAPYSCALSMCLRSVALCMRYGITFTDVELEAMTILDRDSNDKQVKFKSNMISVILKSAIEITNIEINNINN